MANLLIDGEALTEAKAILGNVASLVENSQVPSLGDDIGPDEITRKALEVREQLRAAGGDVITSLRTQAKQTEQVLTTFTAVDQDLEAGIRARGGSGG